MKRMYRLLLTGLLIGLVWPAALADAGEDLQKGWQFLSRNDRLQARRLFTSSAQSPATRAEASLGMALLEWAENDTDQAFEHFKTFYRTSPDPLPYTYALWSTPVLFEKYQARRQTNRLVFMEELLRDPRLNGTLRAMARAAIGDYHLQAGRFAEARQAYNQMGTVGSWQVVGPFDNTSASGFNKDFGALTHPGKEATFRHRFGAPIQWFTPPAERIDKWYDLTYYFHTDDALMYAQTWVNSPQAQEIFLQAGCSGSLKVWVNDQLIASVPEERNCDLDTYAYPIRLNQGHNRILVQVGQSEIDRANFMLRLTDSRGEAVAGLTSSAQGQPYQKAAGPAPAVQPFFAEAYFLKKSKEQPQNFLHHLLLAEVYLHNDKRYEARQALARARALAPDWTLIALRLMHLHQRDDNQTEAGREHERIKTQDPDSYVAILARLEKAKQKANLEEMAAEIQQYKTHYGQSREVDLMEIALIAARKNLPELIQKIKELYQKYPDDPEVITLHYVLETNIQANPQKAIAILKKALTTHYLNNFVDQLAQDYLKKGERKEAEKLYLQRVEALPYTSGHLSELADFYSLSKNYEKALLYRLKCLELGPYMGGFWNKLGMEYENNRQPDKAREAYRQAIRFTPTLVEAHQSLRRLMNRKDFFEEFDKVDAEALFRKSPPASDFPAQSSVVVLHQMQRVVYPQGGTAESNEIVIKVLNQAGIDLWKEYTIPYNEHSQELVIDKAQTLKADGSKVPAETQDNQLVFTDLQPGDAIHLTYRLENQHLGPLTGYFSDQFHFNLSIPVLQSQYSLLMPLESPLNQVVTNGKVPCRTDTVGEFKRYHWELKNAPAVQEEDFMPPLVDIGTQLTVSNFPDWNFVSRWYRDLSATKARRDLEVKEAVAALFEGKSALSELEKAKRIYEYIVNTVSYSSVDFRQSGLVPQRASKTLTTRLGDCKDMSVLFVAMCAEVGIKANLVLIDTRDNGNNHLSLPSIEFNHCIARLQTGGKTYFVEMTNPRQSFGTLPANLMHSSALIIPGEGESGDYTLFKLHTPDRPRNAIDRRTALTVQGTDLELGCTSLRTGELATVWRQMYQDQDEEKQKQQATQNLGSSFSTPLTLISFAAGDLKALADTLTTAYRYRVSGEVKEVAGIGIIRLPWSDGLTSMNFITAGKRHFPMTLWTMLPVEQTRETIVFTIPDGKKLVEIPKSIRLTCGGAEYSLTYTLEKNQLKAVRELRLKKDVLPVEEYEETKAFFRQVVEADTKQLAFK